METFGSEMAEDEITAFLREIGHGTLAFGTEDGSYALPMSFGYDRRRDRCILQLAFGEQSRKRSYIEAGNTVTLSTYYWEDVDHWRSVLARGTLHQLPDEEAPGAARIFAKQAKIPSLDVFGQPLEELDLGWYELRIEEKQGRQAARIAEQG